MKKENKTTKIIILMLAILFIIIFAPFVFIISKRCKGIKECLINDIFNGSYFRIVNE